MTEISKALNEYARNAGLTLPGPASEEDWLKRVAGLLVAIALGNLLFGQSQQVAVVAKVVARGVLGEWAVVVDEGGEAQGLEMGVEQGVFGG